LGCTVLLKITKNYAIEYDVTSEEAMNKICHLLPTTLDDLCKEFFATIGKLIIHDLKTTSVDQICH